MLHLQVRQVTKKQAKQRATWQCCSFNREVCLQLFENTLQCAFVYLQAY